MELTWPLALALLLAVPPAVWLARRGGGRAVAHPLWFVVAPGAGHRSRRGVVRRARLLLVGALALVALAATGPRTRTDGGRRVLVIDLSATRARDLAAVRARLGGFDEAVLVAPGVAPVRLAATAAAATLAPARGTVDAAGLAAGVALALPGARAVEIAAAPPLGDDVGIVALDFHREPLVAGRGRLVVELAVAGQAPVPAAVVARDARGAERARAVPVCLGAAAYAVVPYAGAGGEALTVALEPATDDLGVDDTATIVVPPLAAVPVWIEPALAGSAVARALAVLPTVIPVAAPHPDAIAVVPSTAWAGPARARIVVAAPPPAAPVAALLAVPGSPLVGATSALLAATPAVAVDAAAGAGADPARVWLRAGPHAAVWFDAGARPTLRLTAALDGPLVPIVLADALAAAPFAGTATATVADVRAPVAAPPLPGTPTSPRRGWPVRALLLAAAALVALEALVGRARGAGLALRLALVAGLGGLAARAIAPAHRRVVFVLDVSASVAPELATARRELAARAGALAAADRAALVVVAGGARTVVPLGPPAAVAAWVPGDLAALGLDPARTDLAAGLAVAGQALGGAGGELVLIGDGRDSLRGAAAVPDAPALIGRGFTFVPVDDGDLVRLVAPAATLRAAPGHAVVVPFTLDARVALDVDVAIARRGQRLATRRLRVAAGRSAAAVPVVLDDVGVAELELTITAAGDPVVADNRARVQVEVGGAGRVLQVDASAAGAIGPAALAAVDAVILDDVPGDQLDARAVTALETFVAGGGTLLWSAGPATMARGAGALARLLPVRPPEGDPVALLLIIDRSGSIDAAAGRAAVPGPAELVAAAAALTPGDHFGALAFDVAPTEWIALAPVAPERPVPGLPPARGGTDPTSALVLAGQRLATTPAGMRRLAVVVSDGGFAATAASATTAATALAASGVRVEVIAVGAPDAAARARLAALAAAGGGRLHDAAVVGVAATLPAVRARPAAAGAPVIARGRAAWAATLGPLPPPLVAGAPLAAHLALTPSRDAVVLADAGDAPLLALRGLGAGRVLAWTADLHGRWIDPAIAAALTAAVAAAPGERVALAVASVSDRRTMELRAAASSGDAPARARVIGAAGIHDLLMIPGAPGTARARFAAPAGRLTIETAGARVGVSPVDGEHDHLGVDRALTQLARPGVADSATVWGWLPLLSITLMGFLMIGLALPVATPRT